MYIFMHNDRPVSKVGPCCLLPSPCPQVKVVLKHPPGLVLALRKRICLRIQKKPSGLASFMRRLTMKASALHIGVVESGVAQCGYVPLTPRLHCHLTLCTTVHPSLSSLTITPHPTPSQEARTRCGVMYEAVTGIPKVSRCTADTCTHILFRLCMYVCSS